MNERRPHSPAPCTSSGRDGEAVEVAALEQLDDRGVELRAARVVAGRRSRRQAMRQVARGNEQHVAPELVGGLAHEPS